MVFLFFYFCFTVCLFVFLRNKLGSEDEIKIKNKNHSDYFPIELKSNETRYRVSFGFNPIEKWSE